MPRTKTMRLLLAAKLALHRKRGTTMKRDPKPFEQMTPKEKAAYTRALREAAKNLPYDPADNSLEILHALTADETKPPS